MKNTAKFIGLNVDLPRMAIPPGISTKKAESTDVVVELLDGLFGEHVRNYTSILVLRTRVSGGEGGCQGNG